MQGSGVARGGPGRARPTQISSVPLKFHSKRWQLTAENVCQRYYIIGRRDKYTFYKI